MTNRLAAAMNAHDLDAFAECFAPDYRSEQPAHPSRAFDGPAGGGELAGVFSGVPDFHAELRAAADAGDGTEIAEWRWSGTFTDGSPLRDVRRHGDGHRGGTGRGRMYMEPVDRDGGTSTRWCATRIGHRRRADARGPLAPALSSGSAGDGQAGTAGAGAVEAAGHLGRQAGLTGVALAGDEVVLDADPLAGQSGIAHGGPSPTTPRQSNW